MLWIARGSEGDESMFSVGQRVWHRDGQRSGTVLECDGDRVSSLRTMGPSWIFGRAT